MAARMRNTAAARAHGMLNRAIRRGSVSRLPCETCGRAETEAHHEDYTKPLEVRWLCKLHHVTRHKEISRQSQGRPSNEDYVYVTGKLQRQQVDRVDNLARATGRSRASMLMLLIEEGVVAREKNRTPIDNAQKLQ